MEGSKSLQVSSADTIVQMDVFTGILMTRTAMDDSIAVTMVHIIIRVNVRDAYHIKDSI